MGTNERAGANPKSFTLSTIGIPNHTNPPPTLTTLRSNDLGQFVPTPEAFKRGIFLSEQHWWERGKLRTWVEFTDPTNTLALLTYSFNGDPFVEFEWDNPIPNPRFRAIHSGKEYYLSARGIHVLNNYTK